MISRRTHSSLPTLHTLNPFRQSASYDNIGASSSTSSVNDDSIGDDEEVDELVLIELSISIIYLLEHV
jgi:hypothetical protein